MRGFKCCDWKSLRLIGYTIYTAVFLDLLADVISYIVSPLPLKGNALHDVKALGRISFAIQRQLRMSRFNDTAKVIYLTFLEAPPL
jgi:hypothetical protein